MTSSRFPALAPAMFESLERRMLCVSTAPRVISVVADNRGEVLLAFNRALDPTTVTRASVQMHTSGPDGIIGNADDVKEVVRVKWDPVALRISIKGRLPASITYRVRLNSTIITGVNGQRIDGEFNGPGLASGNGAQGGDFKFVAKRDKTTRPVARFSIVLGAINVVLFRDLTPQTVANFLHYANESAWDGTFFHRSVPSFVVQGGGFLVTAANQISAAHQEAPVINEPGITNTRGRISMAKIGNNPNSATNQWFFNLTNNNATTGAQLDTQNGGFTAFGEVTNGAGAAVMDATAAKPRVDLNGQPESAFDEVPVMDLATIQQTGFNPQRDVISIRRIAILQKISAMPVVAGLTAPPAAPFRAIWSQQPISSAAMFGSETDDDQSPTGRLVASLDI